MRSDTRHYRLFSDFIRPVSLAGMVALVLVSAASVPIAQADSPYLYGIHWWGYTSGQGVPGEPAELLDCPTYGGWDTETILTHSADWWRASWFTGLYADLYTNKNVSMITRIDYNWGETVPSPTNGDYPGWPNVCVNTVNTLANWCHIWQIGNEPNITGECNNWPDSQVAPVGYAQIYRNVRNAIHNSANPSGAGPHLVLIAAPSPGGVIPGIRWMDGNDWLGQVLDNIPNDEIDGIAIHAYGGSLADFQASFASTLALIDSKGCTDKPIYMTEWNRYATPGDAAQEAVAAQFCRDAFTAVHNWNQTPGNHNIICMTWFVYDANQQAGGNWDGHSIEYWRDHGNPLGHPGNLFTAFAETVDLRYPAGVPGLRGVQADFTASKTLGKIPMAVTFTDQSVGSITSWSWTFGDGGTSSLENPSYIYNSPGLYNVTLAATGPSGNDIETKFGYIRVLYRAGDLDGDTDADQTDFGLLQACITGRGVPQYNLNCLAARMDEDTDVDPDDVEVFLNCHTNPNTPANLNCAD